MGSACYSDIVHSQEAEEDYNKRKMKKQRTGEVKMEDDFSILLLDEIVLEFLSRLPMKSLMRFSILSKYFYNSILKDVYFANSHLINYAQKHPFLAFYHLNVNYGTNEQPMLHKNIFHIKGANEIQNVHDDFVDFGKTITADCTFQFRGEFIGYCNGLVCFMPLVSTISYIDLWNFTTDEVLRIFPPVIEHGGKGYRLLSYGFGFDSFSKEYKLVCIVLMFNTMSHKCWVYRFGTKSSWEQVSAPDDSSYPRTSPHSRKSEDVPSTFTKSTFTSYGGAGGGGALFWKTSNPRVILLFDLHQQEFQYIRFPVGGNESLTTDDTRFFEYKGYLGVATRNKTTSSGK